MRRTFGWRGAAAAYAKSAGGFLNSAAKSAAKLGLASGKAGKQLGYALHRTLSAEWLLRERDVVGLPQGLPELLDGAIRAGALRDLPAVPAPLVAAFQACWTAMRMCWGLAATLPWPGTRLWWWKRWPRRRLNWRRRFSGPMTFAASSARPCPLRGSR